MSMDGHFCKRCGKFFDSCECDGPRHAEDDPLPRGLKRIGLILEGLKVHLEGLDQAVDELLAEAESSDNPADLLRRGPICMESRNISGLSRPWHKVAAALQKAQVLQRIRDE